MDRQDRLAEGERVADRFAQPRQRLLLGARDVEHILFDEALAGERARKCDHRFRYVAGRVDGRIQQHRPDAGEQALEPGIAGRR